MKGKSLSEETKTKLSLSNKGENHPLFGKRGENSPNFGKRHSKETKNKLSLLRKGKTHTEETKRKISFAVSGENSPNFGKRGENSHLFGIKRSKETRKKTSLAKMGEKSPSWLGGINYIPYGPGNTGKLKEQIRFRDNYTCQECAKVWEIGKIKFDVHHIDYNKCNHNPWNRITLCNSCHRKTNFNREYWKEKFTFLLQAKYNRLVM